MNRREMIKAGLGGAAMTILGGIPAIAKDKKDKRKILVFGAHPDDPETGAGGTICLLAKAGHDVACVYLTRGQASVSFPDHKIAAQKFVEILNENNTFNQSFVQASASSHPSI